jgi:prepilin-type N-terminal cleavage/methylation domain-containing protein
LFLEIEATTNFRMPRVKNGRLISLPHVQGAAFMQSTPRHSPFATVHSRGQAARFAFTLLELLIAISIIAVLAGLILTVASSASIKAHNAQVTSDIQSLATGIAAFKQRFGVEPPSSITLYEKAAGWTSDARSMGLIRQIWPQFDFTYAAEGGQIDINGDGSYTGDGYTNTSSGAISLSGAECLVFFLGGMPSPASTANQYYANPFLNPPQAGAPTGFSQNPVDPFSLTGSNRLSFAELDKSRLLLYTPPGIPHNTVPPGSPPGNCQHTMNTYLDPLSGQQQPYLYLSSYGGQGYNVSGELSSPPGGTFADIYRQGPNGSTSTTPSPPWNANSFQIISPGGDQQYGMGGEYETANANTLLVGARGVERDNITNFSSGVLAP